ncbi:ribosomal protein s16 [Nannochloropsis oceanica]
MVVRLRLQRFGRHDRPFYRIVAADSRAKRDGRFIERLGSYDPIASKDGVKEVRLHSDRLKYWLAVGAQPSDRVAWLMSKYNLLPAAPIRPSTLQHLPRKERKEVMEAKEKLVVAARAKTAAHKEARAAAGAGGGGKTFHTDARREGEKEGGVVGMLMGGAVMARVRATLVLPWAGGKRT